MTKLLSKTVSNKPLGPKKPGQVSYRWRYYNSSNIDHLNSPLPSPPVFDVDLGIVRAQVVSMVNRAPMPKSPSGKF